MSLTHVLFDNDGVLVDTERLYYEACRRCLDALGVSLTHELFAEYSLMRGLSCFQIAIERGRLDEAELPNARAQLDSLFADLIDANDVAIPGAPAVIERLAPTLTLGVVTSAKRRHFELSHADRRMSRHFAFSYAREDYLRSKPFPDPYLHALVEQKLDAETCIVVEDSPRGMEAALAAGLRCVVIPNPLAPAHAFEGATRKLNNIAALPAFLDTLN